MRGPFDYHPPTADELRPYLGDNWGLCRATLRNRERYKRCVSLKQYAAAQAAAIEARGWARPCEKTIGVLLTLALAAGIRTDHSAFVATQELLRAARLP